MTAPHFAFPFTVANGRMTVNEQDSVADVEDSVEVLLLTPIGSRITELAYGIPEVLFTQSPLPAAGIVTAVQRWEPRAATILVDRIDQLDAKIHHMLATVAVTFGGR